MKPLLLDFLQPIKRKLLCESRRNQLIPKYCQWLFYEQLALEHPSDEFYPSSLAMLNLLEAKVSLSIVLSTYLFELSGIIPTGRLGCTR